jgi:hypothetical protein
MLLHSRLVYLLPDQLEFSSLRLLRRVDDQMIHQLGESDVLGSTQICVGAIANPNSQPPQVLEQLVNGDLHSSNFKSNLLCNSLELQFTEEVH